jgi:predicted membrane protein
LLILIGLIIIFQIGSGKSLFTLGNKKNISSTAVNNEGMVQKNVLFGGSESIFLDPVFNGGNISATFGGVVLDLRKTTLPEGETYLDISAIFGGVQLYVPEGWLIDNRLQAILGGTEDSRRFHEPDHSGKLILQGTLIFGGCEIL